MHMVVCSTISQRRIWLAAWVVTVFSLTMWAGPDAVAQQSRYDTPTSLTQVMRGTDKADQVHEHQGVLALLGASAGGPLDESAETIPNGPFATGTWRVEPYAFAQAGMEGDPHATLTGGGVGFNYYAKDSLAVRGEFFGTDVNQSGDDATGSGFNLLGRWHFLERRDWSLFTEGGAGLLQSDISIPDGPPARNNDGTHFNFSLHAGMGATYRLGPRTDLVGAFRYMHISNAGISGDDENPGLDTVGGYFGISFRF